MAGLGKRIEESVKALDGKQLKKALYLTTKRGLEKHHQWVEDTARTCLAHKNDPDASACDQAIKEARDKLQATITVGIESADLEGVEEYLTPKGEENMPKNMPAQAQKTDEELYQGCEECHVADAVVKFVSISREDCNGATGQSLEPLLEDETTPPEKWVETMREVASKEGCGQEAYKTVLGELEGYLEERNSPILDKANEEDNG
jgi:hypothetical protein